MASLAWKAVGSHRGRFHLSEPAESDSPPGGAEFRPELGESPCLKGAAHGFWLKRGGGSYQVQ